MKFFIVFACLIAACAAVPYYGGSYGYGINHGGYAINTHTIAAPAIVSGPILTKGYGLGHGLAYGNGYLGNAYGLGYNGLGYGGLGYGGLGYGYGKGGLLYK